MEEDKKGFIDTFREWDRTGKWVVFVMFFGMVIDGMNIQVLSLALPNIIKEHHISLVNAGAISSYTFVGMGIGGIFGGWVSDRIGRKKVVFWSIFSFSLLTTLIGFSTEYWHIAALRFLSGLGMGSVFGTGSLLASEYVPTKIRTTILGGMQAGWSLGYVVAGVVASYLLIPYGWRSLFVVCFIPGVVVLMMLKNVPEPKSWVSLKQATAAAGKKTNEYVLLYRDKKQFRTLCLWMTTSTFLLFGYYGSLTWLPSYLVKDLGINLKSMGWYVAATYTLMMAGKVIAGYTADMFGRRLMWVVYGVSTAVFMPVLVIYASANNVMYLLLIFGFLYGAPYGIAGAYINESYPTNVRGTAVALSHNVGRIGSFVAPVLLGYLGSQYSIGLGIGVLGIAYFICAVIPGLFIREKMYDTVAVSAVQLDVKPTDSK